MTRKGVAQKQHPGPRRDVRWQDHAACRNSDPRLFSDPKLARWGLQICEECPAIAKVECAKLGKGCEGVWAGQANYPLRPRGLSAR